MKRDIYWIATESVGKKRTVVEDYQEEALGGITLTIEDIETEFLDYWQKLSPKNNKRNIWFAKFWEQMAKGCKLKDIDCGNSPLMIEFDFLHIFQV